MKLKSYSTILLIATIVNVAFILICTLNDLFTNAVQSSAHLLTYVKLFCVWLVHQWVRRLLLIPMLRWRFVQILKIVKVCSNLQYLFTLSEFVAMKPQTSEKCQVRRLALQKGFQYYTRFSLARQRCQS